MPYLFPPTLPSPTSIIEGIFGEQYVVVVVEVVVVVVVWFGERL